MNTSIKNEKAAAFFAKMREMVRKYRERQAEMAKNEQNKQEQ